MDENNQDAGTVNECDICIEKRKHGGWLYAVLPPNAHHCHGCHQTWYGRRISHCAVCHTSFTSQDISDLHLKDGPNESVTHLDPHAIIGKDGRTVIVLYPNMDGHGHSAWGPPGLDPTQFYESRVRLAEAGRQARQEGRQLREVPLNADD